MTHYNNAAKKQCINHMSLSTGTNDGSYNQHLYTSSHKSGINKFS